MNFVFQPYNDKVPEWDECYYDQALVLNMLHQLKSSINLLASIKINFTNKTCQNSSAIMIPEASLSSHSIPQPNSSIRLRESSKKAKYERILEKLIYEQYELFTRYARHEEKIVAIFMQYKTFQLEEKLVNYVKLIDKLKYQSN